MIGTDYPFDMGNYNSVAGVESAAGLTDAQKDLILGGNAMRLFNLG
jgi:predicted TIM-barrel fold metal-dependent hydrolase